MNADIISMYVKLPLFKHLNSFCGTHVFQSFARKSQVDHYQLCLIITVVKEFMRAHTG